MDHLEMNRRAFEGVYAGKKVLVTGNTGFKGSWLTLWLLEMGAKVFGLSNTVPGSPCMFNELNIDHKINHYWADIRDASKVREIVREVQPDFVFHLAAQALVSVSYEYPLDTISTNVLGTANVLEALRLENPDCTAVIITSDKCYDNVEWVWGYKETDALGGKDIYSGSKGAAEIVFKSYYNSFFKGEDCRVRLVTARAGNVIGGGDWALDRIIPDCIRSWSKGEPVEIRSPKATRPWQHVLEPLSGYLTLGQKLSKDKSLNGQSFNFGPQAENSHTVVDLISAIGKIFGQPQGQESFTITDNIPFHEAGLLKLNCDKALFHLHWMSTLQYEELIHFTADWYHNWNSKKVNMYDFTLEQLRSYQEKAVERKQIWIQG
ncbi:MAG: CDP-glucose 4,6-dehydratase [Bacteroidales bacterium]|nr:CDP-glucose 4,6-dehydratase [Bacteroidales bacterium]